MKSEYKHLKGEVGYCIRRCHETLNNQHDVFDYWTGQIGVAYREQFNIGNRYRFIIQQNILDYILSNDRQLFLIGYQLLKQQNIIT